MRKHVPSTRQGDYAIYLKHLNPSNCLCLTHTIKVQWRQLAHLVSIFDKIIVVDWQIYIVN